jgi:nitroreductase
MRSARGGTFARSTARNRSSPSSSTRSWRQRGGLLRRAQPWDFVLVTEREQLRQLSEVWAGARHVADSAATIALIAPSVDEPRKQELEQYDLGQATMSIAIAAADLGLGSAHAAVGDQDLARALLGFPEDHFCAYLIAIGHPADRPLAPLTKIDRRPFDEVVHRGRW